ncbi:MAG TPA: MmgE/PrpD family protein [Candidatus Limnocylindria bacterium]|nr:MmgE/PrpD family protein [Candidatus Limnocylindria bacterium]
MPSTSAPSGLASAFARELARAAAELLAPEIRREAERSLLNVLGLAVGAARHEGVDAILAAARVLGGTPSAAIPGRAERADAHFAALASGFAAHVDDFDDTHLVTVIHPGAAVLAVLVALAPSTAASGSRALSAFALGCEAQLRLGVAISPEHYDRGWHITGTCGVVGAAVAAALLLGYDETGLAHAIRLASTMALGHREAFGTMTKAFHPGKAAANGIDAALLARTSIDAPSAILEAPGGFADALSTRADFGPLLADIGTRWELAANTYKPYPCGIVAHPSIDAALALAPDAAAQMIAAVSVRVHPLVPELMGNPDPTDGLQARFSAIHGVAAALCDGRVGLAQYETERVRRDDVRAVRAKTTLLPDPAIARDEALLELRLADGTALREHVVHARGSLARPLTDEELLDKVRLLVEPVLGAGAERRLAEGVRALSGGLPLQTLFERTLPEHATHA